MIKVTTRATVGEDRQLRIAVPEEIPIGPVLVTIAPLRDEPDVDDDEYIELPPGSPSIADLIDEDRGER